MKKILVLTAVILLLSALAPILPTAEDRAIYDKTVRLHVLANSDTAQDQELKLSVRDAILAYLAPYLEGVESKEEAVAVITEHTDALYAEAEAVVAQKGKSDAVSITLREEYYPRKQYESVTLPAGNYLSLQIKVGKSEGQNWWCVLFPTLCTSSATPEEELTQAGFTVGQVRLITDSRSTRYKLKFRLLELFEGIG